MESIDALCAELQKPVLANDFYGDAESFNPYVVIDCFYGTYDGDFDECAIDVLQDIYQGSTQRADLAARMFREVLCVKELCDYGTSPRVCFPTPEFKEILPDFIAKWEEYRKIKWG